MEFSFATISFIDLSVLSICMITLWWLKKQVDHYKVQSEEAEQRYNTVVEQHNALLQEFRAFQSTADRRYNTLQQEHETFQQEHIVLKEENANLRVGLDAITREHKVLQAAHDRLTGRHDEIVERVMPVFEILAREKLMEINARNAN